MSEDKKATGFQGENIAQTATSSSAEDAMVPTFEEPRNLSEKELALEKKLVRKIDIRLMPCLILVSFEGNEPSVGLVRQVEERCFFFATLMLNFPSLFLLEFSFSCTS